MMFMVLNLIKSMIIFIFNHLRSTQKIALWQITTKKFAEVFNNNLSISYYNIIIALFFFIIIIINFFLIIYNFLLKEGVMLYKQCLYY